jgi:hypothetical protein
MIIFTLTVNSVSHILIYTTAEVHSKSLYHRNVSVSIVALLRKRNNNALSHCYATGRQSHVTKET